MLGTVLHFDQSRGILRGDDQNRYYFQPTDWLNAVPPLTGQRVDFVPDGPNALEVFLQEMGPTSSETPPDVYLPGNPQPYRPALPTASAAQSFLGSFLSFDKMIAPTIIIILYYLTLVVLVFVGIGLIYKGMDSPYGGNYQIGVGCGVLVFGPLQARLFSEFFIVVFKIHTRLRSLDEKTPPQP